MNKKIIIFGTTMFSAEIAEIMRMEEARVGGAEIVGFVVDRQYKNCDIFQNLPVFAFENIEEQVDINAVQFILTLGYSNMNEHRQAKFNYCKSRGYKVFTYVSQHAQVFTDKVGEGSIILPGTYIGPYSEVGVCTVIRPGTVLAHHDSIGDFNWIADGCTFGGGVKVGSHCFLGLGTTVRNEITIADYTFAGAQTYLGLNTESHSAYIGVPSRKIPDKDSIEVVTHV